ncbi:MAG: MGMT family protein [Halomonas sp.]|uniref:MGMT family protein n=2 Tax=Halomonadaceae TaxID=28256 RepID=A0ABS6ZSX2_9GAMM|nr:MULTISPECIES: MGMT family protein [Halomonas]MBW6393183.1 MGMT family protein [Halomonas antri]MDX5376060.1 MGMT family protein [Halomonas sp.]MDX5501961.1 MGMT family protein [Halomonas sp.]QTP60753.1 cysteine methyltransferase [Halomonas sulfidivorans]
MKPVLREQILTILAAIPPGRVTTYGRIAAMTEGGTPRLVARALRELPEDHDLPWFRVITASRRLAEHPGAIEQRQRLVAEGVLFDARGRVPAEALWP